MRSYYDAARAALERHGGAVEKFIGDAVVGMFGVSEANEDDALRACRAALEIQERLAELKGWQEAGIAVRIGVNTGEVVAGDAARREMFASGDAVVLGDSVNVAARLEQAAAPGEILVGEATYRLVRDAVMVEPVEPVEAKGKSKPLICFRLLGVSRAGPTRARRRRCARRTCERARAARARARAGGRRRLPARDRGGRAGCRKVAARSGARRGSGGPGAGGAGGLPLLRGGDHVLAAHTGGAGAGGDRGRGVAPGGAGAARRVCRGLAGRGRGGGSGGAASRAGRGRDDAGRSSPGR